jgi:hypothetical protein
MKRSADIWNQAVASSEVYLFAEEVEALACIDTLILVDGDAELGNNTPTSQDRNAALNRWRQILDRYLECPTLLDQSLELMVQRLADGVLQQYVSNANASTTNGGDDINDENDETAATTAHSERHALSALYALCKVRGRKIVQKFLPHSVEDLDPVWNALRALICRPEEESGSASEKVPTSTTAAAPLWESVYMLWNWMAVLSLIPFDCKVVTDAHFWHVLLETAQGHLTDAGPVREAGWLSHWTLEREIATIYSVVRWNCRLKYNS